MNLTRCLLLTALFASAGCAGDGVRMLQAPNESDLRTITNGQYELKVWPAAGRIVSYGPAGGANLLWFNKRGPETGSPFKGWTNWGGDKVWIWPEGDWGAWDKAGGPPPGDPAPGDYEVKVADRRVTMTSPVLPNYGVRVVREISLAEKGSQVTIVNRLEQVNAPAKALAVAPWTVTQTPAPKQILARLATDAKGAGYEAFKPNLWKDVQATGRVVTLNRPATPWVKMGLDAEALAVPLGDWLFTVSVPDQTGEHERFRRAQIFSDPDDSSFRPKGVTAYIEMEFTGPTKKLNVGEFVSLTTVWELHKLGAGNPSAEEIMAGKTAP